MVSFISSYYYFKEFPFNNNVKFLSFYYYYNLSACKLSLTYFTKWDSIVYSNKCILLSITSQIYYSSYLIFLCISKYADSFELSSLFNYFAFLKFSSSNKSFNYKFFKSSPGVFWISLLLFNN